MGKTLKYGSHDFPTSFGFTGSSGSGPVKVRSHTRTRPARSSPGRDVAPVGAPPKISPRPMGKPPHGPTFDARASSGAPIQPAAIPNLKGGGAPKIKKGLLHSKLGIPQDQPISSAKLAKAKNKAKETGNSKLMKEVVFAQNVRKAKGGEVTKSEVKRIADKEVAVHNRNPNAHPNMAAGGVVRKNSPAMKVTKVGKNPQSEAYQVVHPTTDEVVETGSPGRKLRAGYDTGGPVSAVPNLRPGPAPEDQGGGSAYQGDTSGERFRDNYQRGQAPATIGGIAAALGNMSSLVGGVAPIQAALATGVERGLGLPEGSLGGIQTVPGYVGPNPARKAGITDQASLDAARAADTAPGSERGPGVGPEGHWSGHDSTTSGGVGSGTGALGGGQGERAGFRRGGAMRRCRGGFNGKPMVGIK